MQGGDRCWEGGGGEGKKREAGDEAQCRRWWWAGTAKRGRQPRPAGPGRPRCQEQRSPVKRPPGGAAGRAGPGSWPGLERAGSGPALAGRHAGHA